MPKEYPWKTYDLWCKEYGGFILTFLSSHSAHEILRLGDIVYVTMLGQPMLIVGSAEAANLLFEKHSTTFSGRPYSTMIMEYMGWDWSFGTLT
jgi:hypothetical protein